MDPLTAAIGSINVQEKPSAQADAVTAGADATTAASYSEACLLGDAACDAVPVAESSDEHSSTAGDAESMSRLSPLPSPRAPSPHLASCPIPVPGSSTNSLSGCSAQQQEFTAEQPLAAGADLLVALPSGRANHNELPSTWPALSPPDPELKPDDLEQLLQKASPAIKDNRFSMAEFLKNKPAMTAAARRELVGGVDHSTHRSTADDDDIASALEDAGHAADVSRQSAHLSGLVQAVAEESKVNRELAGLLVEQLDASKKSVDCLMRLLTCLMEAEAAYSAAMSTAAKTASSGPLAAPSDSSGLAAALEGMVALPAAAAAGHRQLYLELQILTDGARGLWRRYTATAKELKQSVHTAQRGIDGCCKQLMSSFNDHKSACEAFDAAVVWHSTTASSRNSSNAGALAALEQQQRQQWHRRTVSADSAGGSGARTSWGGAATAAAAAGVAAAAVLRPRFSAAPVRDPWTTEGKLVADQEALKRLQDQERALLQRGFETLQMLEKERIAGLLRAGQALSASYPAAVQGLPPAAEQLRERLGGLGDAGNAGLQHLAKTAAEMRATSEELAARQQESLASVAQELFCSPEIIRQGPMDLWNPSNSTWVLCHFVLTRAGFLHWFKSMEETLPLEVPLNLSRCEFEAGQAPAFHLVEAGTGSWLVGRGSRKVTLKAASVEECCEWAIALRESIALSSSTGPASGGSGHTGSGRH